MTYLGLTTGPALGGFLTQHFGWPSVFYVNVPIALIVIPAAFIVLPRDHAEARQPFDPAGAISLAVALAGLLLALSMGNRIGWGSPVVVVSMVLSAAAFTIFILVETAVEHPMLDLKLFTHRVFAASTMAAFLNYAATSSVSFLMPFYLIRAANYRVDMAGWVLVATPAVMALVAGPAGWLSDRIGQRLPATFGMALTVVGMLLLRTLAVDSSPERVMLHLAIIGFGVGLFTSPNNSAIMGSAPVGRQGVAGAILAAARNIGFAIGVAVAVLVYVSKLNSLTVLMPEPQAITRAMQDSTTTIALLASPGILVSALRGRTRRP
jgi:MFS family permease